MQHFPLFIFEGPDAVGKTQLALQCAEQINAMYWHTTCTPALAPAMFDYQSNIIANVKENLTFRPVVLDRLWPSEFCYGPIFRPDMPIDTNRIKEQLADLCPVYIFCLDELGGNNAAARHELLIDGAHPYTPAEYKQVYANYVALAKEMDFQAQAFQNAPRFKIERRYFDNRLTNQNAVWHYNNGFIQALTKKHK